MDINLLVKITARAWSLHILALLHDGVPGRQAALLSQMPAGRTAFAASMSHLVDLKLVERNPGHGHPLRPEFRLTPGGVQAARVAKRIVSAVGNPDGAAFSLLRRRWSVPILSITNAPTRFSDIKAALPSITDRALSQSLYRLEEQAWLRRSFDTSRRSPRPIYQAANTGAAISTILRPQNNWA
ncbi:winged helix-turn-helix transcriptional regulator [Yoonia sp. SS1-5]|uniref:Winged helix-turn-helix transcriptional regulator n=1 Tax=Yoonia rhodophyticola TaxID=3137370 RepID=A0AAN0NLK0_9RHOB